MDSSSSHLRLQSTPDLRSPTLICAFAGWNDAAEVATHAVRFLIRTWEATRFADVDPEDFFVFSEQRPLVKIDRGAQRRIEWPANEFYYRRGGPDGQDFIFLIGTEPQLRWRTFVDTIVGQIQALRVPLVVVLGGLLADVPHSRPPRLTGSATSAEFSERLGRLNVRSSRYEGPTGILGVLGQACRTRGVASVSLWGNVPHYIGSTPNPKITAALLRSVDTLLGLRLDLREIDNSVAHFEQQVAEAIQRDPEAQAYVRQLEDRDALGDVESEPEPIPPSDLPSGEEVVRELEEFLKRQRPEDETR